MALRASGRGWHAGPHCVSSAAQGHARLRLRRPGTGTANPDAVAPWILDLAHQLPILDGHGAPIQPGSNGLEFPKGPFKVFDCPVHHCACRTRTDLCIRWNEFDPKLADLQDGERGLFQTHLSSRGKRLRVPGQGLRRNRGVDHQRSNVRGEHQATCVVAALEVRCCGASRPRHSEDRADGQARSAEHRTST